MEGLVKKPSMVLPVIAPHSLWFSLVNTAKSYTMRVQNSIALKPTRVKLNSDTRNTSASASLDLTAPLTTVTITPVYSRTLSAQMMERHSHANAKMSTVA